MTDQLFDVHLEIPTCIKLTGISAPSMQAAIALAECDVRCQEVINKTPIADNGDRIEWTEGSPTAAFVVPAGSDTRNPDSLSKVWHHKDAETGEWLEGLLPTRPASRPEVMWIAMHYHAKGVRPYVIWQRERPTTKDVVTNFKIDFYPANGEKIQIEGPWVYPNGVPQQSDQLVRAVKQYGSTEAINPAGMPNPCGLVFPHSLGDTDVQIPYSQAIGRGSQDAPDKAERIGAADDSHAIREMLGEFAEVVCKYAGGKPTIAHNANARKFHDTQAATFLLEVVGDDQVPPSGGIWASYDKDGGFIFEVPVTPLPRKSNDLSPAIASIERLRRRSQAQRRKPS